MTFQAQHSSVSINRSAAHVYEFAANPANLPTWAAGLGGASQHVNEDWVAESPLGRIIIKFAEANHFGMLDHAVTLPAGVTVDTPMRVVPNNDGRELIFTVYRWSDMVADIFVADAQAVTRYLAPLKTRLEA